MSYVSLYQVLSAQQPLPRPGFPHQPQCNFSDEFKQKGGVGIRVDVEEKRRNTKSEEVMKHIEEYNEIMRKRVEHLETLVDGLQKKERLLERRCYKFEEERQKMVTLVSDLQEENKALKETFSKKMSEMQRDLLSMVEHCLIFEKDLSKTKEENQRMRSHIKELVEERDTSKIEKE